MTEYKYIKPPNELLEACENPNVGELKTNHDLIIYTSLLVSALEKCAKKIELIKGFYNERVE